MIKLYKEILSISAFCVASFSSFGQVITNKSSIFINDNATVAVNGGFQNDGKLDINLSKNVDINGDFNNTNSVVNNGDIYIAGNWDNVSDYRGKGAITMDGEELQTLNNNDKGIEFLFIKKNNGKVSLSGDVRVHKEISLEDGIVQTNDSRLTLSDTISIAGGSFSSYVDGHIYQEGTSGEKYYPLGVDGNYTPFEMSKIHGDRDVVFKVGAASNINKQIQVGLGLLRVDSLAYWRVESVKGKFQKANVWLDHNNLSTFLGTEEGYQLVVAEAEDALGYYRNRNNQNEAFDIESGVISEDTIQNKNPVAYYALGVRGEITEENAFYIPTALSPFAENNEDKRVKVYDVFLDSQSEMSFVVFDKWENKVFESTSYKEMVQEGGWTGISDKSGEILPTGSYSLIFKASLDNGKEINYKSTITIIQ